MMMSATEARDHAIMLSTEQRQQHNHTTQVASILPHAHRLHQFDRGGINFHSDIVWRMRGRCVPTLCRAVIKSNKRRLSARSREVNGELAARARACSQVMIPRACVYVCACRFGRIDCNVDRVISKQHTHQQHTKNTRLITAILRIVRTNKHTHTPKL